MIFVMSLAGSPCHHYKAPGGKIGSTASRLTLPFYSTDRGDEVGSAQ